MSEKRLHVIVVGAGKNKAPKWNESVSLIEHQGLAGLAAAHGLEKARLTRLGISRYWIVAHLSAKQHISCHCRQRDGAQR